MNKLKYIASQVLNSPVLATPEYLETVVAVLSDRIGIDAEGMSISGEAKGDKPYQVIGNTAIIPILGGMVHRGSNLDAMSGIKGYNSIQSEIQEALDDPAVENILMEVDSGGGEVAGAFDLRDFIMSAKEEKPIYALAKDTMGSAAYLISSAATEVYATQTAKVGSIGVVAMHTDYSEANSEAGIKPTFIHAGKYKVAGNPHEPLEGDALSYLQESVDQSYDMFVGAVSEARGMSDDSVRATEAKMFSSKDAMDLGLIDGIMSYDSVISKLTTRGNNMSNELQIALDASKQENEVLKAQILDAGFAITKEGLVAKEPEESMDCNGVKVFKSEVPEALWEKMKADQAALELAAKEKEDAKLLAAATEALPNFDPAVAAKVYKEFGEDECIMAAMKASDAEFGKAFAEIGKAEPKELTAKEAVDELVNKAMEADKTLTKEKALSHVAKEHASLVTKMYEENK